MPERGKKMKKKQKEKNPQETVVKDLAEIGRAAATVKLAMPRLQLPTLTGMGDAVEAKLTAIKQLGQDVPSAVKFITDANAQIAACGDDKLRLRVVKAEMEKPLAEMNAYINQALGLDEKILRAAAAEAYLDAVFSQQQENWDQAMSMLHDLVNRGILVRPDQEAEFDRSTSSVMVGYQHYTINPNLGMDQDQVAAVGAQIGKFSRVLISLEKQRRDEKSMAIKARAEITMDDARAGENGKCVIVVPPEQYEDDRGQRRWRGGGDILVEFQKNEIFPLEASGSIEDQVQEMIRRQVALRRDALGRNVPPGFGNRAFDEFVDSVCHNLGLSLADAGVYVRKVQALWHMINRAVKRDNEAKAVAEVRKQLKDKATITMAEFFELDGSTGKTVNKSAFMELRATLNLREGPRVSNPFFLATWREKNGKTFFELTEVPPHLKEIFGHLQGRQYPMDDYKDWPVQLGQVVKAIRDQEEMVAAAATE
jgi:uncharacterized protein YdaU (DUF1376 family)